MKNLIVFHKLLESTTKLYPFCKNVGGVFFECLSKLELKLTLLFRMGFEVCAALS